MTRTSHIGDCWVNKNICFSCSCLNAYSYTNIHFDNINRSYMYKTRIQSLEHNKSLQLQDTCDNWGGLQGQIHLYMINLLLITFLCVIFKTHTVGHFTDIMAPAVSCRLISNCCSVLMCWNSFVNFLWIRTGIGDQRDASFNGFYWAEMSILWVEEERWSLYNKTK